MKLLVWKCHNLYVLGKEIDLEDWKRVCINGEETLYEISSMGRCRRIDKLHWKTQGVLTPKLNKKSGYCQYCVVHNGNRYYMYAHRLVAEYFIPNELNKAYVNHIDGNKQNNTVVNLEWCTAEENMRHAMNNNLCSHQKEVDVYDLRGEYIGRFISISEGMRQLGIREDKYNNKLIFDGGVHYGYQWRRVGIDNEPVEDVYDKWLSSEGCVQLDLEGNFIKHYPLITEAYKELGKRDNGAISHCCLGKRKTVWGYKWVFAKIYYS